MSQTNPQFCCSDQILHLVQIVPLSVKVWLVRLVELQIPLLYVVYASKLTLFPGPVACSTDFCSRTGRAWERGYKSTYAVEFYTLNNYKNDRQWCNRRVSSSEGTNFLIAVKLQEGKSLLCGACVKEAHF